MKQTKKALIMSVLSVMLCAAMLVGGTFAWFTDTASTSVNKIVSGDLDVDLVNGEGVTLVGQTLTFKTADNRAAENILWEPGCTYVLDDMYVLNKGNLAIKYEIVISGIQGDAKLNEAIEWTISLPDGGLLAPTKTSSEITIQGHMKEEAGNEYENLTIDGISITVNATQVPYEKDSYTDQYDKNAEYDTIVAETQDALNEAIDTAEPGDVILLSEGTYELGGSQSGKAVEGVTFVGSGDTVLESVNGSVDCTYKAMTVNDIYTLQGTTFEDCTIAAPVNDVACATRLLDDAEFVGCTFTANGKGTSLWLDDVSADTSVTFEGCTFVDNIRLGGGETNAYTFKDCEFKGGTVNWSKALIVAYCPITLDNCTYEYTGGALYAVRLSDGVPVSDVTVIGDATIKVSEFGTIYTVTAAGAVKD